MTREIADAVPSDSPGALEIGFSIPLRYNASRILFDNPASSLGTKLWTVRLVPQKNHSGGV